MRTPRGGARRGRSTRHLDWSKGEIVCDHRRSKITSTIGRESQGMEKEGKGIYTDDNKTQKRRPKEIKIGTRGAEVTIQRRETQRQGMEDVRVSRKRR